MSRRALLSIISVFFLVIPAIAGTWTSNNFLYKPGLGARGEGEKKTFDSGLERVDARLGKEIWVGDPGYGITLPEAITAIGGNQVVLRIPAGVWSIDANLTIPSNIDIKMERGAKFTGTKTVIINGGFEAGIYQVFNFSGNGAVIFGNNVIYVFSEWWGEDATAFSKAISTGKTINILQKTYPFDLTISGGCTIAGNGEGSYIAGNITLSADNVTLRKIRCKRIMDSAARSNIKIQNCLIDQLNLGNSGTHAIYFLYPPTNLEISGCEIRNSTGTGIVCYRDTRSPRNDGIGSNIRLTQNYLYNTAIGINLVGNKDASNSESIAFENIIIANNEFKDIGYAGHGNAIYLTGIKNFSVTGNVIRNMARDGMEMGYTSDSVYSGVQNGTISNNSICDINGYGIVVCSCNDVTISGNSLRNCPTSGIVMYSGFGNYPNNNVNIIGNTIKEFLYFGIKLQGDNNDINMVGNTIDGIDGAVSTRYGVFLYGGNMTAISINNNTIKKVFRGLYMDNYHDYTPSIPLTTAGLSFCNNNVSEIGQRGIHYDDSITLSNIIMVNNIFRNSIATPILVKIPYNYTNSLMQNNYVNDTSGSYRLNDYVRGLAINYGSINSAQQSNYSAHVGDIVYSTAPSAGGKIGKVVTSISPVVWKDFGTIDP